MYTGYLDGFGNVIYFEVPTDIYLDLDLTAPIGADVREFAESIGLEVFVYFVPSPVHPSV